MFLSASFNDLRAISPELWLSHITYVYKPTIRYFLSLVVNIQVAFVFYLVFYVYDEFLLLSKWALAIVFTI